MMSTAPGRLEPTMLATLSERVGASRTGFSRPTFELLRRFWMGTGPETGVSDIGIDGMDSESGGAAGVELSMRATLFARAAMVPPAIISTQSLTSEAGAIGMTFWSARAISRAVGKRFAGSEARPFKTRESSSFGIVGTWRLGGSTFGDMTFASVFASFSA
jgi:hypothetical protein